MYAALYTFKCCPADRKLLLVSPCLCSIFSWLWSTPTSALCPKLKVSGLYYNYNWPPGKEPLHPMAPVFLDFFSSMSLAGRMILSAYSQGDVAKCISAAVSPTLLPFPRCLCPSLGLPRRQHKGRGRAGCACMQVAHTDCSQHIHTHTCTHTGKANLLPLPSVAMLQPLVLHSEPV